MNQIKTFTVGISLLENIQPDLEGKCFSFAALFLVSKTMPVATLVKLLPIPRTCLSQVKPSIVVDIHDSITLNLDSSSENNNSLFYTHTHTHTHIYIYIYSVHKCLDSKEVSIWGNYNLSSVSAQ